LREITSAAVTDPNPDPLTTKIENATKSLTLSYQKRLGTLFPNIRRNGSAIQLDIMLNAYKDYKSYFTSLSSSEDVPGGKKRITEILRKRWNPYVHRHSAITEKSRIRCKVEAVAGSEICSLGNGE
jgi:hypothetical protein